MALRIKDNVDLKELEKFGFDYNGIFYSYEWFSDYSLGIKINSNDRIIIIDSGEYGHEDRKTTNKLYDLIKAGLVEKVEEENENNQL